MMKLSVGILILINGYDHDDPEDGNYLEEQRPVHGTQGAIS